jgi:alpha-mannosidase
MQTKVIGVFLFLIFGFLVIFPRYVFGVTQKIYIGDDDHTDYMWTANEATYRSAFIEMLDYYMARADSTSGNPFQYQDKFTTDGTYWLKIYRDNKPAQFDALISKIRNGSITIPLNTLALVYGGQSVESVIRGMYFAGKLEREYNIRFPLAIAQENQTFPFGVSSLWVGSGAKYSWKGICNCVSQLNFYGKTRDQEIYYQTGLDNSKLLLKWNSLMQGDNMGIGGYAENRTGPFSAIDFVGTSAFTSKYSYSTVGLFGWGWDDLKTTNSVDFPATAQSKTNASRQVIVSNTVDFFQDFENQYSSSLPSQSVTFGNEWDLFASTAQEYSSRLKRSLEKLRSAEAMATLVSLQNPNFNMDNFTTTREQAFINLSLFWEHCGGSEAGGLAQGLRPTWMKGLVSTFEGYVNKLYNDALLSFSSMIQKTGENIRFFVFNPLSYERNDFSDFKYTGSLPIHVIDLSTSLEVPSQVISKGGTQYIRVLASNIPSVGYKVYEIQSGVGQTYENISANVSTGVIENSLYKATVNSRGAITGLFDKTRNKEFVKVINSKYVNDLGGSGGSLALENVGPVSTTILATSSSPLSHTSRITLYSGGIDRIDIENNITQNFTNLQTFAFSFNLTNPETHEEEVGAVIKAKKVSDGGQYSNNADLTRYDYLTINHFVDMMGNDLTGVTISNRDLNFMKLGNSTLSTLDTSTSQVSLVAGGSLSSGEDYSPVQLGVTNFTEHFSLKTHGAYSQTESMKFALSHQNPLIASQIQGGSDYPETNFSLLTISDPNVLLWALKPSEEGINQGIIVRAWNQANSTTPVVMTFPSRTISGIKKITHIETNLSDLVVSNNSLNYSFGKQEMATFRFATSFLNYPTPTPSCVLFDIDCSGQVNAIDLSKLLLKFGQSGGVPEDVDGSGQVNALDLAILLANFGK